MEESALTEKDELELKLLGHDGRVGREDVAAVKGVGGIERS